MDEERDALIHGAYLAAMQDAAAGWTPWVRRAAEWVGGPLGYMGLVDRSAGVLTWNAVHHPDPAAVARYHAEGIYLLDPQVAITARLERSCLYRDVDVLDFDDPQTAAHNDWVERNGGTRHYATVAAVIADGRWVGGLSVHNAVAQGVTSDDQWRRLASLAEPIERALTFGVLHAEKLRDEWWDARLDAASEPAALIDERGVPLRMTADFAAALERDDGLRLVGGRLAAADPASQRRLATMIARATAATGAAADAVSVERDDARPAYVVCVWPLARERRALVPDRAAALLTLIDPLAGRAPQAEAWRGAFGLTAREAEVARTLVEGFAPDEAASQLGVSIATVRVHLRQLFAKTQTSRQAELVRLLLRFG